MAAWEGAGTVATVGQVLRPQGALHVVWGGEKECLPRGGKLEAQSNQQFDPIHFAISLFA